MEKKFVAEMLISEAMKLHPRAAEGFASFHLGGCSSCAISEEETIDQVTHNYGVEVEVLLETLNSLLEDESQVKVELPPEADLSQTS